MDEHELEQRLRARLHARYDRGGPPEAYRSSLMRSLTPEAARGGGFRFALSTAWPILAAAAVLAIAVAVLALRPAAVVGPGATPTASPSPSASAAPSPTPVAPTPGASTPGSPSLAPSPSAAVPEGSVPPLSTSAWSGLDVQKLAGAPAGLGSVAWSGGYVGFALNDTTRATTAWTSRDGRAWTAMSPETFGLNDASGNTEVIGVAPCADGVLVATNTSSGQLLWWSTDGSTWTSAPMTGVGRWGITGNARGAVAPADSGLSARVTTDCRSWRNVSLPGRSGGTLRAVAATPDGFVAAGYAGAMGAPNVEPLAWFSRDGVQWSSATVAAKTGDGFISVFAGASGLIAFSTQPGVAPGLTSMWSSANGRSWALSNRDPFGIVGQCAGSGSAAGAFYADGTHLLGSGAKGGCAGPLEYWISLDGVRWTRLTLTGDVSAATSGLPVAGPSLMRDGILFGGTAGTWFGAATNP